MTPTTKLARDIDPRFPADYHLPTDRAAPFVVTIADAAAANNVHPVALTELLHQESRYRTDIIHGELKSAVGAEGIAQFMPATAEEWKVDTLDPTSAINGAARYLRWLLDQTGNYAAALGAYNWGIGNVTRRGLAAAPAETRNYIADITDRAMDGGVDLTTP